MDRTFRKELPDMLDAIAPEYGMVELQYPSFVRAYGFLTQPLASADCVEAVSALLDAATGVRLEVDVDGGRGGGEWFGSAKLWNAADVMGKKKSAGAGKEGLGLEGSLGAKGEEDDEKNKTWRKNYWIAYDSLGSEYVRLPVRLLISNRLAFTQRYEHSSTSACPPPCQDSA
jgi:cell division control protein 45